MDVEKHLVWEDENYGRLECQYYDSDCFMHFEWLGGKFGRREYNCLLDVWNSVLKGLNAKGVENIYSIIPKEEGKVIKWQTLFGLAPIYENDDKWIFARETM